MALPPWDVPVCLPLLEAVFNRLTPSLPRLLSVPGLGYLIGPVLGSSFWRMTHRRAMRLIERRDKEFHEHIVKNRVDPIRQSATNPVPDYYGECAPSQSVRTFSLQHEGEKIGSLHDYRQVSQFPLALLLTLILHVCSG